MPQDYTYIQNITYEDKSISHILFPGDDNIKNLNYRMSLSASNYDNINPNLITKLIPPHYLDESESSQIISSKITSGSLGIPTIPGSGKIKENLHIIFT